MKNESEETKTININELEAGALVRSWCGKCKDFREHTVHAKATTAKKAPRAVCNTCNALHMVRLHRPGTKTAKAKVEKVDPQKAWREQVEEVEVEGWKKYTIKEAFTKDEYIEHRKFGKGKVIKVLNKHQVRILFQEGVKLMMQNK